MLMRSCGSVFVFSRSVRGYGVALVKCRGHRVVFSYGKQLHETNEASDCSGYPTWLDSQHDEQGALQVRITRQVATNHPPKRNAERPHDLHVQHGATTQTRATRSQEVIKGGTPILKSVGVLFLFARRKSYSFFPAVKLFCVWICICLPFVVDCRYQHSS